MKYLFAAFAVLLSCSSQAGEIQDMFGKFDDAVRDDMIVEPLDYVPADHGITEIGIERTVCLGTCPAYTFIATSDGTVRYVGEAHVGYLGTGTGKIPPWKFDQLANFIKESNYMNFHLGYAVGATDLPSAYTMVVMNGQRKIVFDYGGAGPATLSVIEHLIDDLKAEVEWDQ